MASRRNRHALIVSLELMIIQANQAIADAGGCDHSVGICCCEQLAEINDAIIALGKFSKPAVKRIYNAMKQRA